jgi:hypothetical protein
MRLQEFTDEITFHDEHINSHHGQSDMVLRAMRGGRSGTEVGRIEYSIYRGEPAIQHISVSEHRQKIATRMLQHLQSLFPGIEIDWGGTTDDGTALKKSINFKKLPNKSVRKDKIRLAILMKRLEKIQNFFDTATPDEINHLDLSNKYNTIHDEVESIRYRLHGKKDTIDLIEY